MTCHCAHNRIELQTQSASHPASICSTLVAVGIVTYHDGRYYIAFHRLNSVFGHVTLRGAHTNAWAIEWYKNDLLYDGRRWWAIEIDDKLVMVIN